MLTPVALLALLSLSTPPSPALAPHPELVIGNVSLSAAVAVDPQLPPAAEPEPGVTPVPEPHDAGELVGLVLEGLAGIRSGRTEVGVGFLLMVLVFVVRKLAPRRVPKKYLSTVLLGTTALGGFAAAIAAGLPVLDSALSTLVLGAAAIGLWEGIAKHLVEWWED